MYFPAEISVPDTLLLYSDFHTVARSNGSRCKSFFLQARRFCSSEKVWRNMNAMTWERLWEEPWKIVAHYTQAACCDLFRFCRVFTRDYFADPQSFVLVTCLMFAVVMPDRGYFADPQGLLI
jgi:hypothetical protein